MQISHYAMLATTGGIRTHLLSDIEWDHCTATFFLKGRLANLYKFQDCRHILKASPLHLAAAYGILDSIRFVKKHGLILNIDVPTGDECRYTPLHLATIGDQLSATKLLLEYGANVNVVDGMNGETALHYAAELGFLDIVDMLLKADCHPDTLDCNGMTPEFLAIKNGHMGVANLLTRHLGQLEEQVGSVPDVEVSTQGATVPANSEKLQPVKSWSLPLQRGPNIGQVMKEGICIYAVDEATCPSELRELLNQHKGKEVTKLGRPFRRRLADTQGKKSLDSAGGNVR
jgi:hypothetical protein